MKSWIFFIVAAVLLGCALFGSEAVAEFVNNPDYEKPIQIFIGLLGVLAGLAGWLSGSSRGNGQGDEIAISGGVHQSGENNRLTIANKINQGRQSGDQD